MAQSTDKRRIQIERPKTPEEQAAADKAAEVRNSADRIARQIIDMTRNGLFVTLRFMDVALCQFSYINSDQLAENMKRVRTIATTGQHMIYDPQYVIEQYMKDKQSLSRDYLHMVLHCVFRHPFVSSGLDRAAWDLACDIAVEVIICDLDVRQANTRDAKDISEEIERIKAMMNGQMTAERLYAWLRSGGAQRKDMEKWRHLFHRDDHAVWWDIAKQIEEEMKRKAEEEKDERVQEDDHDTQPDPEDESEDADSDNDEDDEAGADGDGEGEESDEEGGEDGDDDASGDGSEEEGEENSEEDTEASEENDGEEEEEGSKEGEEAPEEEHEEAEEDSEEDDGWREEEYEEEYSSVPGESMERENPDDMADPDSDTHDTGEDSDDNGSGGGGAGDDPEQSEDEGSGAGESPEGMSGEASDEGKQDDERRPDSNMSGTAGEGQQDDSPGEDPFGDDDNGGSSQNMSGSGGKQQQGTSSGEHSAGSGGGGDGSQSAWEHSSGEATQRGSGDDGERSQMSGSSGSKEELKPGAEQQKQEAQAEQGTADSGEDEEDKAPSYMHSGEEQRELEQKWKEISERMLVDLETSSKEWGDKSDGMLQGIKKINRDKYDYATFLRKFSTLKEDIQINDDEFDYVYYTLGMERYGNIPLIEPLEYKEVRKVRDFVIAIDTSGSCAGDVVQKFLDKTFSIFMQQENFFRKINLHIIQCDAQIQEVAKITDKTEFEDYIRNLEFKGFGGTDFRPVFEYVNTMIDAGEFDDLKGLIYFTDGNGTYPKRRPPYETAFIFVDDDEFEYQVPSWAMKLVLETSDITEEVLI